jgi:hypothetical protein
MTSPRRWRRWRAPVSIGLVVVAVAVAAAFTNVALLGSAGEDRLGKLSPVDAGLSTTEPERTVTAPPPTTAVTTPSVPTTPPATISDGGAPDANPPREADHDGDDD